MCEKPDTNDCKFYNILTSDQHSKLFTPSNKLKKEKCEAKKSVKTAVMDTSSPSLVDPTLVLVVGVVDGQGTVQSPGFRVPPEKKKKVEKEVSAMKLAKSSTDNPPKSYQIAGQPGPQQTPG